ncbi:MAG: glycosyltransferase [Acidimicrobiia bacterium]
MQIFVVETRFAESDRGAGDPRSALIGRLLSEFPFAKVTWFASERNDSDRYQAALVQMGITPVDEPPAYALAARANDADVVVVARPENFEWAAGIIDRYQPQARKVYDFESLFHLRMEREAQLRVGDERDRFAVMARTLRELERAAAFWADAVLCVGQAEQDFVRSIRPALPVGIASYFPEVVPPFVPRDARNAVAYFGGFRAGPHGPNSEGAILAARKVQPLLGMPLEISGACPPENVLGLAGPDVRVVGPVPDFRAYIASRLVLLCPMLVGAGIKLRFVDAAACGTPFVTTAVGAEGIGLDGELARLLVAETPEQLAERTRALVDDKGCWNAASDGLRALATERFTREQFASALRLAVLGPRSEPHP